MEQGDQAPPVVSLEAPHDSIHLAVGGFDLPSFPGLPGGDASPIEGANADMGENDTASLDPIFFFHHCFVDRVFWLWQKRQDSIWTSSRDTRAPTRGKTLTRAQAPTSTPTSRWI